MSTVDTPLTIAREWLEKAKPTKRLATITTGRETLPGATVDALYSYGPHYPMLMRADLPDRPESPGAYLNLDDYYLTPNDAPCWQGNSWHGRTKRSKSMTTARHRRAALRALESLGYRDMGANAEHKGYTFRLYVKNPKPRWDDHVTYVDA